MPGEIWRSNTYLFEGSGAKSAISAHRNRSLLSKYLNDAKQNLILSWLPLVLVYHIKCVLFADITILDPPPLLWVYIIYPLRNRLC